jgi:hypothetical protein
MTVVAEDLRQLDQWVREDRWPRVACPVCKVGHLNPDGITGVLSGRSTRMYDETHMVQARFGDAGLEAGQIDLPRLKSRRGSHPS